MTSGAGGSGASLRALARGALTSLQKLRIRPLDTAELSASAVVFAPHQDDETLGCGGTVVRKTTAGASVSVVFLTDGSGSHPQLMAREQLVETRAGEAFAALGVLGIAPKDVRFLGAPDGALVNHADTIVPALREILEDRRPEQVFVPYARDRLSDHEATRDLLLTAARQVARSLTVFEYPVWFWDHWPWMQQSAGSATHRTRRFVRESLALLMDFNTHVAIGDVLETKIAALECHRTQMTRFDGSDEWPTLGDVAGGDFLRCLLRDSEIFHRWSLR